MNILWISRGSQSTLFLWLILIHGLSGCSQPVEGLAVSGRVTLNGRPLPHGLVMFMPKQQSARHHTVQAEITEGVFSVPASSRLLVGSYRVAITGEKKTGRKITADEGSTELEDERRQYIPPIYNAQTTLSAEITEDTNDLEFELTL